MRTAILALVAALACGSAAAQVYVAPYTDNQGNFHQGHMRSAPDGNPHNNYSTRGNVNPYTGQPGTVNPQQNQVPPGHVTPGYVAPGSSYVQPGIQNQPVNRRPAY